MYKVRFVCQPNSDYEEFCKEIEKELAIIERNKEELIDVKYSSAAWYNSEEDFEAVEYSALIIYQKEQEVEEENELFARLYNCLNKLDEEIPFRRPEIDFIRRFVKENDSHLVENILDKETPCK